MYCKVSSLRLTDKVLHLTGFVSYHKSILVSRKRIDVSGSNITQAVHIKGQIKSEYVYEIIDYPKYHRNFLIDFCPESFFRLGMLRTHPSRIIKTNHMYLVYKSFQGRNLSNFSGVFFFLEKINDFTNTF